MRWILARSSSSRADSWAGDIHSFSMNELSRSTSSPVSSEICKSVKRALSLAGFMGRSRVEGFAFVPGLHGLLEFRIHGLRDHDSQDDELVAARAAVSRRNPFSGNPESLARADARGNREKNRAVDGGDFHL